MLQQLQPEQTDTYIHKQHTNNFCQFGCTDLGQRELFYSALETTGIIIRLSSRFVSLLLTSDRKSSRWYSDQNRV